jgi:hypothetical protein
MKETKELQPEKTYLFTKEILGINEWFPRKRKAWTIKTFRKKIRLFVLPIGKVFGYAIVRNKLMIIVKFHPPEVTERVPRQCKNQVYELNSNNLEKYLSGELPPIARPGSLTYAGKDLSACNRKRMANMLQSQTIDYNEKFDRKDRLSARYTGIFELETEDELRSVLEEIQNAPLIHSDDEGLNECRINSFHLEDPMVKEVICFQSVLALYGGRVEAFQEAVREVRRKLKGMKHVYRYLEGVPPGRYLLTG